MLYNFNSNQLERSWRFSEAVGVNESDIEVADIAKENYTVVPVKKHIGVILLCKKCHKNFNFSAKEQKRWYETLKFWIDSVPLECKDCRSAKRNIINLNNRLAVVLHKEKMVTSDFNEIVDIIFTLCNLKVEIGSKLRAKALMAAKRADHKDALNLITVLKKV